MSLDKAAAAIAKIAALGEVRPDLAPVAKAAVAVIDAVITDAKAQIEKAEAQTVRAVEIGNENADAVAEVIKERDQAEAKIQDTEIAVRAERIKILQEMRHRQFEVTKRAADEVVLGERLEKIEKSVATLTPAVEILTFLHKCCRSVTDGLSPIQSKSAGPWWVFAPVSKETWKADTRKDLLDAYRIVRGEIPRGLESGTDPVLTPDLDDEEDKKKGRPTTLQTRRQLSKIVKRVP